MFPIWPVTKLTHSKRGWYLLYPVPKWHVPKQPHLDWRENLISDESKMAHYQMCTLPKRPAPVWHHYPTCTHSHTTVTRWRLESTYIHTMHTTCTEQNSYTWLRQIYLTIQDRLTERSKHLSPSSHLMTLTFATATQRRGRAFVRTTVRQCGDGWHSNFCTRTILTVAITHCRYTNDVTH